MIFRAIFARFYAQKPTLCPLLKSKVGSKKPSVYNALRAQSPKTHLFSILNAIKSLIILYNYTKKSGLLGIAHFERKKHLF